MSAKTDKKPKAKKQVKLSKNDPAVMQANVLRDKLARAMYDYACKRGATTHKERLAILKPIVKQAKAVADEIDAVFIETMVEELRVDWVESLQRIFFATVEPVSLDVPAFAGTDQSGSEYVDPIINFMHSHEDGPEALAHKAGMLTSLNTCIDNVLSQREAFVIRRSFGLCDDGEWTLVECAKVMNVTRERARQIEESALRKLLDASTRDPHLRGLVS